jgi:hypothetical protein
MRPAHRGTHPRVDGFGGWSVDWGESFSCFVVALSAMTVGIKQSRRGMTFCLSTSSGQEFISNCQDIMQPGYPVKSKYYLILLTHNMQF